VDTPVIEFTHERAGRIKEQVARYIAGIIEDGSTLQIGLGRIPNEALKYLDDRKDLGIHSDVITDVSSTSWRRASSPGREGAASGR
jgi:acyl-CoA hydrolase